MTARERSKRDGERDAQRARYAAARELGVPAGERMVISRSVARFGALLDSLGIPRERYGLLGIVRKGGRPPVGDEAATQRQRRYRFLRDLGLSSLDACAGACTAGVWQHTLRKLGVKQPEPRTDFGLNNEESP